MLLKRWNPLFDLDREHLGARPIWVQLPGLHMHLWKEEIFRNIGNILGTYLDHDRSFTITGKMAFDCILVHLDIREGLEESLKIHWRNTTWVQLMDYEGAPFHFCQCQKVGHVYKECLLSPLTT